MKTLPEAEELAQSICKVANEMGVDTNCLITRMDFPIGEMIGNANETYECL
jgi:thymidine phosphorylase